QMRHDRRSVIVRMGMAVLVAVMAAAGTPSGAGAAVAAGVVADRVLVGFVAGTAPSDAAAAVAAAGGRQTRAVGAGTHVVQVAPGTVPTAIAKLRAFPSVRYAEADFVLRRFGVSPNDPGYSHQWAW